MGTDRLYQVLPIMRELKKERREEVEQFFQDAPDWLLDSFHVVELKKKCCIYQRKSASRYRTHYCEGDV